MKNRLLRRGITLALASSMLLTTGCSKSTSDTENLGKQAAATDVDGTEASETTVVDDNASEQPNVVHNGKKIKIKRDEDIKLELGYNLNDVADRGIHDSFKVFMDPELKYELDSVLMDFDYDTYTLNINSNVSGVGVISTEPGSDIDLSHLSGSYLYDENARSWGTFDQIYLVNYTDLETGEVLDVPEMTVVDIDEELNTAPQVVFSQTDDGRSRFYWKEVEGATQYIVYKIYKFDNGYNSYAEAFDIVDTNEWICESAKNESEPDENVNTLNMNDRFEGENEYFDELVGVIAVNETGASALSNMIDIDDLQSTLPNRKDYEGESGEALSRVYNNGLELPTTMGIKMCDGTTTQKVIEYDIDNYKRESENKIEILAKAHGTQFGNYLTIMNFDPETIDEELRQVKERQDSLLNKGGDVLGPDITITDGEDEAPATPDDATSDDTVDTPDDTNSTTGDEDTTPDNENTTSDDTVDTPDDTNSTTDNTVNTPDDTVNTPDDTVNTPDGENSTPDNTVNTPDDTVDTPDNTSDDKLDTPQQSESPVQNGKFTVYGNTALAKYIATEMLTTKELIDLSAYPEYVDKEAVLDAFHEAVDQNPLILGIQALSYDTGSGLLYVDYDYDPATTATKQEEVQQKVDEVVSEIITDGMSDLEKDLAINAYLCDNASYDDAACENAKEHDFYGVDEEFYDSFTAYGILVNGVGVCASYAADYKLLADAAGLDCVVVTGMLEGSLPHAWNKVKIDGQWCIVDATNNDNDTFKDGLLNLSDECSNGVLVESDEFVVDSYVSGFAAPSDDKEYYHVSGKYFSQSEIVDKLAEELKTNGQATFRTDYDLTEEDFYTIAQSVVDKTGGSLNGGYWFGMVYLQAQ